MRVLVTGGAGYIGSVSVRMLLDAGHEVTVLDSLCRGHARAVDDRARLVVGSVGDAAAAHDALAGCDAVLHLAGLIEVAESVREPERYVRANVEEPEILLAVMRETGVQSIVFSSTAAVYGEPESVPIGEDAATRPVNPYGASKLAFERLLGDAGRAGLRSVTFRYFNVAGAWPDGSLGESHEPETHIIPRLLGAVLRGETSFPVFGGDFPTYDGTCVRDYIHVCDLARAHQMALERLYDGGPGDIINLGNGNGFSNLEVLAAVNRVTGACIEPAVVDRRPGDPAVLVASSDRAREVLGWLPQRPSLDEMIADAWRFHVAHPNGYR